MKALLYLAFLPTVLVACQQEPSCASGELLDGELCVPESCGLGPFGTITPEDADLFVAPGAKRGDGSFASPLGDLSKALRWVRTGKAGPRVALSDGDFDGGLELSGDLKGIELRGRCTELSRIVPTEAEQTLLTAKVDMTLSHLTLTGGGTGLLVTGGRTEAHHILVTRTEGFGIAVLSPLEPPELLLEDSVIHHITPNADGNGRGLEATYNASVTVRRSDFHHNATLGLFAWGPGTTVDLEEVIIRDGIPNAGDGGYAMEVREGAHVTLSNCRLEKLVGVAVMVSGDEPTYVNLNDSIIDGTRPLDTGEGIAFGLQGLRQAKVSGTGLQVVNTLGIGLGLKGSGSTLDLQNARFEGNVSSPGLDLGSGGVALREGASGRIQDSNFVANQGLSASATLGASLEIVRSSISEMESFSGGAGGFAVEISLGGHLMAKDLSIAHTRGIGLFVTGLGTTASVDGMEVFDIIPSALRSSGIGVAVQDAQFSGTGLYIHDTTGPGIYLLNASNTTLEEVLVEDAGFAGLISLDGTELTAHDLTIRNIHPGVDGAGFGIGIRSYFSPTKLILSNSSITGTEQAGIYFYGAGAYQVLNTVIDSVVPSEFQGLPIQGNAVTAVSGIGPWDGSAGLMFEGVTFGQSSDPAILLQDASATFSQSIWDGANTLLQQQCGDNPPPEILGPSPSLTLCPTLEQPIFPLEFHIQIQSASAQF